MYTRKGEGREGAEGSSISKRAAVSSAGRRCDRLDLITRIRRIRVRLVAESGRIHRSRIPFFFPLFVSLFSFFFSLSIEIAKRTRGNNSMDKLARETHEPVTRGRYFYESRGIRPKPAYFHVLFPSLVTAKIKKTREKEKDNKREEIDTLESRAIFARART